MKGEWKSKPDDMLNVMQEAVVNWKTVGQADHLRSKSHLKACDKDTKSRLKARDRSSRDEGLRKHQCTSCKGLGALNTESCERRIEH